MMMCERVVVIEGFFVMFVLVGFFVGMYMLVDG